MSLRQALQKLRSGTEAKECHVNDNNDISVDCMEYDFDLSSEFFEPDEFWNTSTPLQNAVPDCVNASSDAITDRTPLMQICDQSVASRNTSFIPSKHGLSVTSNSSSQKLKAFTFSRNNRKEVTDSDGLPPPSKKPASEKELTRHSGSSQHTPFGSVPSTPSNSSQVNSIISNPGPVTSLKSSTPIMIPGSKRSNETPSLPVTPVSCRSAAKRKFPGPAGLLPKLLPNQSLDDVKLSVAVSPSFTPRSKVTTIVDLLPSSQGDSCDFSGTVWKSAVDDLSSLSYKDNDTQETCCISELMKDRQLRRDQKGLLLEKIPFLVVMLKSIVPQGNGACVTLKDSTGEMPAAFHSKVYEEYQSELIPGTVLILYKVSLFSPSQKRRYLNITSKNILKIFLQNGSVVINEEAKGNDPVGVNSTPRTCNPPQDNLLDSVELFNTDISQEWCKFPDDTSGTNVTTAVVIVSAPSASVSNPTNSSTITTTHSHVVTCSDTHNSSFTANSSSSYVQDYATAIFTDGLEDEDLDSLLRDFEEDHLCT